MTHTVSLERATPESQGVASSAILAFVDGVESAHLGLHSFMLLRHGKVLAEAWWRPFAPAAPHVLYSLTKSFTSTAAGLAISEGRLSLDDAVLSFFPEEAPADPSEHWRELKVRHLLSMATGHEEEPGRAFWDLSPQEWLAGMLRTELKYKPGTHFLYNSIASHMVSVILQRVTGQKVEDYLADRLFEPLGIEPPYWETDPLGHNWGGWGLYLRTEDIANFGQMVLDYGQWQGRQLVPRQWLEQATSKQIDNGTNPDSDWAQGYGFQYWMSRHGFRGDGAFGQFCVVLRQHDTVLVTTASTPDMQGILDVAWRTLLPALADGPLPDDAAAASALTARLADLQVEGPQGKATSPSEMTVLDRTYRLDENALGWEALRIIRDGDALALHLTTRDGQKVVGLGASGWTEGEVVLDYPMPLPIAASARWQAPHLLDAAIIYLFPASTRRLTLEFNGDTVEVRTRLNGAFAPPDEMTITGR